MSCARHRLLRGEPLSVQFLDAPDLKTESFHQKRAPICGIGDLDGHNDRITGPVNLPIGFELQCGGDNGREFLALRCRTGVVHRARISASEK